VNQFHWRVSRRSGAPCSGTHHAPLQMAQVAVHQTRRCFYRELPSGLAPCVVEFYWFTRHLTAAGIKHTIARAVLYASIAHITQHLPKAVLSELWVACETKVHITI